MPPLKAYAIDIVGSMTGIAAFTSSPRWAPTRGLVRRRGRAGRRAGAGPRLSIWTLANGGALVVVLSLVLVHTQANHGRHLVAVLPHRLVHRSRQRPRAPHRRRHPAPGAPPGRRGRTEQFYDQVYRWFPERTFDDVLIVGAGSGSDVALALAQRRRPHRRGRDRPAASSRSAASDTPTSPYDDPRVTPHTSTTAAPSCAPRDKKYDLVIFALPDSLTLVSQQVERPARVVPVHRAGVRSVRDHLSDDGIFVLYNYYRETGWSTSWPTMLEDAFGHPPLVNVYGAAHGGARRRPAGRVAARWRAARPTA